MARTHIWLSIILLALFAFNLLFILSYRQAPSPSRKPAAASATAAPAVAPVQAVEEQAETPADNVRQQVPATPPLVQPATAQHAAVTQPTHPSPGTAIRPPRSIPPGAPSPGKSRQEQNDLGFQGTCGLASCQYVLNLFGVKASLNDVVHYAAHNGLCTITDSTATSGSTSIAEQVQILSAFGVPAHYSFAGTLDELTETIMKGHVAILEVNSGVLWHMASGDDADKPNHSIVVTGVSTDLANSPERKFFINDSSAAANESAESIDADTLSLAWVETGGISVVTDDDEQTALLKSAMEHAARAARMPIRLDKVSTDSESGELVVEYTIPYFFCSATATKHGLIYAGYQLIWAAMPHNGSVRGYVLRGYAYGDEKKESTLAMVANITSAQAAAARSASDYVTASRYLNSPWWHPEIADAPL